MQKFVGTILVVLVCLAVFSSPVTAGDVLGPGDIAIIGYNLNKDYNEFAFVCLKPVAALTEIRFTDMGWKSNQTFRFVPEEGIISWYDGCYLGQVIKIIPSQHTQNTTYRFLFTNAGDQIFVYQYFGGINTVIFGLNAGGADWQSTSDSDYNSALPSSLASLIPSPSISLTSYDNAVYTGSKSFTSPSEALASIVNPANWTGDASGPQSMPTGDFSFTTTAVHLSDFSAETGGESAPWWVLVGLVIIPILVLVVKRPKRNCCK
jgi:hypothetical protein